MIREAESQDSQQIQRLYETLCPGLPIKVLPERIQEIKENPDNSILVYEQDGQVLGSVFFTVCLSPMFGVQNFGVIEYFIVDESVRGRGIGGKLLNEVFVIARARKCTGILLLSSLHREEAHQFFKKHGFNSDAKKGFVKYLNR